MRACAKVFSCRSTLSRRHLETAARTPAPAIPVRAGWSRTNIARAGRCAGIGSGASRQRPARELSNAGTAIRRVARLDRPLRPRLTERRILLALLRPLGRIFHPLLE